MKYARHQRGLAFERLAQDVRYGARMLRRAPLFTVVAVSAIALAVGINAGFFTLVDALMLRPLPVANPSRLVKLLSIDARSNTSIRFSYPAATTIAAHARTIEDVILFDAEPITLRVSPSARATAGSEASVSGNYFTALGGHATLGRTLLASDAVDGAAPVVVISDPLWHRAFDRARDVIGREVVINGSHATIVGVAAPDFIGINPLVPDLWIPVTLAARIGATPGQLRDPANRFLVLRARVREGVDRHQAEAELSALIAEPRAAPGTTAELSRITGIALLPNDAAIPIQGETALLAAPGFVIVFLVLLIACANLANLLLARALVRQREIAVRLALGASRARLVRQLLTESMLIALAGAAFGTLGARWTVSVLSRSFLAAVPATYGTVAMNFDPSWRVLVYTLCLTIVSVLVFGLAPALQATGRALSSALKGDDTLFGTHIRRSRFRDGLITAQVAACLVLLAAAGTLVQNLRDAATIQTGLDPSHVTIAHLGLAATGHVTPALATSRRQFAERVGAVRGVRSAALVLQPPFTPWRVLHVSALTATGAIHGMFSNAVTSRYFDVVGQRLLSGRSFSVEDSVAGARVAIVTPSAARTLWPGQVAVGQSLRIVTGADSAGKIVRVIGVVSDTRSGMIYDNESTGYVYLPLTSADLATRDVSLLVRSDDIRSDVGRAIIDFARDVDPDAPLTTSRLTDTFVLQLLPYRYAALVASGVGGLGILLAVLGLYGVVAFAVAQRQREIAIHVAVGAGPRDVLALVLRREMRLVLYGLVIGTVLALGEARLLGSLIIPLTPLGVGALVLLALILGAVAALATAAPSVAALRIAPIQVLRQE